MARSHQIPCPRRCGHTMTEHVEYHINTSKEHYLCHCGCKVSPEGLASVTPASAGVRRVGDHWDYA
jgi:hypothetical protein